MKGDAFLDCIDNLMALRLRTFWMPITGTEDNCLKAVSFVALECEFCLLSTKLGYLSTIIYGRI